MRRMAGVVALGTVVVTAGCGVGEAPQRILQGGDDITVNVVACQVDPTTGLATATYELTSEQPYSSVLLRGELSDATGVVIGTGTGAASSIEPGQTYRDDIIFSLTSQPQGDVSCDVSVDLANP